MKYAVIMAGGIGTRFWPASRKEHPKQFLDIFGDGTPPFSSFQRLRLRIGCLPRIAPTLLSTLTRR